MQGQVTDVMAERLKTAGVTDAPQHRASVTSKDAFYDNSAQQQPVSQQTYDYGQGGDSSWGNSGMQ
jgi:uridine phosphorylase